MKKATLAILCFLITIITSCNKENMGDDYKYEVTGTSTSYNVTIQNADNNTQQWGNVGNGWNYTWKQTSKRWLYLSAQNLKSSGNVTVKIYKKGKVVAENTSFGGFTIATVSGDF